MRARTIYDLIPFSLLLGTGVFLLGLSFMRLGWAWAIPDLFPSAVAQGMIAESLSWSEATKLALALAALAGIFAASSYKGSQRTSR